MTDADLKFAAPWEARAFAIVVSLSQAGHFTWSEWVEHFSAEVALDAGAEAAGGRPRSYCGAAAGAALRGGGGRHRQRPAMAR